MCVCLLLGWHLSSEVLHPTLSCISELTMGMHCDSSHRVVLGLFHLHVLLGGCMNQVLP